MSQSLPTRRNWLATTATSLGAAAALTSTGCASGTVAPSAPGHPTRPSSPFPSTAPHAPAATFDVRAFGAKGDGLADDAASIQQALDAAIRARAGRIHFPAGRYRISRPLHLSSADHLDLTGDGLSTLLMQEADEPLLLAPAGVSLRESSLRNLRFTSTAGDKSHSTPVIALLGGVERSLFSNLHFIRTTHRLGSGIATESVADTTTFDNVLMWRISGCGIRVARGSEVRILGGRITGDFEFNPANVAIELTGNNGGVHVVTTDLIGVHTGLKIGAPGAPANREIFITHATFDSSKHGLWQRDSAYTSIAGCWAASCDEDQILLDESAVGAILSVSGGTIFNGGAYGRPGAHNGIVVRAGSFTLTGVSIRHNLGTGILADGPRVHDYAITGCRIHNNTTGARLGGDRYVLANNIFSNNSTDLVNSAPTNVASANLFSA